MEQLLCHLVGDYFLQSSFMAYKKMESWTVAFIHAITYTLPFLFLSKDPVVLGTICVTHAIIDRTSVAKKFALWRLPKQMPEYLSVWIAIIYDNTLHLLINYLSITYLTGILDPPSVC